MKFILTAKHWQLFPVILISYVLSNFTIDFNMTYTAILRSVGHLLLLLWPLLVGHALYEYLPNRISLNYNLFLINAFIAILTLITIDVISDGEGMTFHGLAALPFFYVIFAVATLVLFPARVLLCIEQNKRVKKGECVGVILLILILPIGIWFLQPRLNKIVAVKSDVEQPLL